MGSTDNIQEFIMELKKKLKSKMPEIRKEIRLYEEHIKKGTINKKPIPAPQFNV
ncbi:MAG: hypothetical protein GY751_12435 [Bacteroidetes bacterium]|nr:hypothetical protein [Bacteroidota bacterium]